MILHYTTDETWRPIPCEDLMTWARWMASANRSVAKTKVGNMEVSTVFLGFICPYFNGEDGSFFESMVFAPHETIEKLCKATSEDMRSIFARFLGNMEIQKRYRTIEEARAGHDQIVKFVEEFFAARN